jgi:hypothetical protein
METKELEKLRINSTNIKNSLFSFNKQMRKLRIDENKLIINKQKRDQAEEKEKKLETPGKGLIENIKSKIIAGPMSIFDKIKEFFGIVLVGLVINNLPQIVSKVTEAGNSLITVASSIIDVIKQTVNGVNGFISIIQSLPESTKRKLIEGKDQLENFILELNKIIDPMNTEYTKLKKDLDGKQGGTPPRGSSSTPDNSKPSDQPIKRAAGGTVSNTPPQQGTGKGGPSGKPDAKVTSSPYARPGGTPSLRRARQSYNAFGDFYDLSKENKLTSESLGVTSDSLSEVNKAFSSFLTELKTLVLGKQFTTAPMNSPASQTPIPTTGQTGTIPITTNDVIGTVGSTGRVTGPHIHIERVGNYSLGIPNDVKKNILIEGEPMTTKLTPTDKIGNYSWRKSQSNPTGLHKGEDWAGPAGQRITLTGGLEFLKFMPDSGSGYGNQVYIVAPDGTQYTLNHLDSGPPNLQQLLKNQQRTKQIRNAPVSPTTLQPGQQGPVIPQGYGQSLSLLEEEDEVQIVMINTVQPVIQKRTRTVVVNSGRKDPFPSSSPDLLPLPGIWNV